MTRPEFLRALEELGFIESTKANDLGLSAFARFLGITDRTARNMARDGVEGAPAILLRLMLATGTDAAAAAAALERQAKRRRR
jgi:hypothetical protein